MDAFLTETIKLADKIDPNNIFWLLAIVAFFKYVFPQLRPMLDRFIDHLDVVDKRKHEQRERLNKSLVQATETIQNLEHIISELVSNQKTKCSEHFRRIEPYLKNIFGILADIRRESDDFAPMCSSAEEDLEKIKESFKI